VIVPCRAGATRAEIAISAACPDTVNWKGVVNRSSRTLQKREYGLHRSIVTIGSAIRQHQNPYLRSNSGARTHRALRNPFSIAT
jgi:hypothetical protein